MSLRDADLVDEALAGSKPAFAALVDRYQVRLLRFLVGRCRSRADAEDVLQDSFVNAWRYLASFDTARPFSTWLYRIAIRNASRLPAAPEACDEIVDTDSDPLVACIIAGERENLWSTAKRELRPEVYSALWLHYVEDMPVREIAEALDRSLAWVKVALSRGRRRLQVELISTATKNTGSQAYG